MLNVGQKSETKAINRGVVVFVGRRHEVFARIKERLSNLGYKVPFASTALDALAQQEAHGNQTRAIVFDDAFLERFGSQIVDFFAEFTPNVRRVLLDTGTDSFEFRGRLDAVLQVVCTTNEIASSILGEKPSRRKRLLFVDDELDVLSGIQMNLRRELRGCESAWETNGNAALQKFLTHPYDVVVSDFQMPGIDGVELLLKIKERNPRTRSVILTGHDFSGDISGVDAILRKPCPPEVLRHIVFSE